MRSKIAGPPKSEGVDSEMSRKTMTSGLGLGFLHPEPGCQQLVWEQTGTVYCSKELLPFKSSCRMLNHVTQDQAIPLFKVHCISSCPMFVRPAKHMVTAWVSIKTKFYHLIPLSQQDNFHCSDVPLQFYMLLAFHDLNYNREHFINLIWSYTSHVYLLY